MNKQGQVKYIVCTGWNRTPSNKRLDVVSVLYRVTPHERKKFAFNVNHTFYDETNKDVLTLTNENISEFKTYQMVKDFIANGGRLEIRKPKKMARAALDNFNVWTDN